MHVVDLNVRPTRDLKMSVWRVIELHIVRLKVRHIGKLHHIWARVVLLLIFKEVPIAIVTLKSSTINR